MSRRYFSRFIRWLAMGMGVYFIITAILSITVDPWRINGTPLAIDALDGVREIGNTVRVGKAALANRGHWKIVILGSSRIEIALDPEHPAFHGERAVNLAMPAANLYETVPEGNYVLDRNPQIQTLILGIEPDDLYSDYDSRKYTGFYQSPFADNNHSIERGINQVIGGRALMDSLFTLQRYFQGHAPERNPLGRWLEPNYPVNLREYVESTFHGGYEMAADQWNLRPQILHQPKVRLLAGLIGRVRQAGIRMEIVIPPRHALSQIHPTADHPKSIAWEPGLRSLIEICRKANATLAKGPPVQLWCFLTFNPNTSIAMPRPGASPRQMPGWFDLGHSKKDLGDLVLNTVFAGSPGVAATPPVGVNLLDVDWAAYQAAWIEGHRAYCATQPQDVAWWRGLIARSTDQRKATRSVAEGDP